MLLEGIINIQCERKATRSSKEILSRQQSMCASTKRGGCIDPGKGECLNYRSINLLNVLSELYGSKLMRGWWHAKMLLKDSK